MDLGCLFPKQEEMIVALLRTHTAALYLLQGVAAAVPLRQFLVYCWLLGDAVGGYDPLCMSARNELLAVHTVLWINKFGAMVNDVLLANCKYSHLDLYRHPYGHQEIFN